MPRATNKDFSRTAATAAVLLALAGCASPQVRPSDALARMEQRELRRPVERARLAPPPPGVPADLIPTDAPAESRARMTLDDALDALIASDDARSARGAERSPDPESVRAYVGGRAALLAGDAETAEEQLTTAIQRDPASVAAWEALAMLRAASGDAMGATAAWRETVALDPSNIRALEQLGQTALQRGNTLRAARLLARAHRSDAASIDPGLPYIVAANLSEALAAEGYLVASAHAAAEAATAPTPFDQPTREETRLGAVIRGRADLLRSAGDGLLRAGLTQDAIAAYEKAIDVAASPDPALLARLVYALQLDGRPAAAARAVVDAVEELDGRLTPLHLSIIRHTASLGDVRAQMVAALAPTGDAGPDDDLVRARAAVLPRDEAVSLLTRHALSNPLDDAAQRDLIDLLLEEDTATAAHRIAALADALPLQAERLARQLVMTSGDVQAIIAALEPPATEEGATAPQQDPHAMGASLVRAFALRDAGRFIAAEDALRAAMGVSDSPAVTLALVDVLASSGRVDDATALLSEMPVSTDEQRLAKGLAALSLQQSNDAILLLRPLAESESVAKAISARAALAAAQASLNLGDRDSAEAFLRRRVELAPDREEGYAGLIALYLAEGVEQRHAEIADVVRTLRERLPGSRTISLLQAQELLGQGQLREAKSILLDLAMADPSDVQVMNQLLAVWQRLDQLDEAEAFLRERAAQPAAAPTATPALARVLVARDKAGEAAGLLRAWLRQRPADTNASRMLESVLRDHLNDPAGADTLAAARLAMAPPTLETAIETADLLRRRGDVRGAFERLIEALRDRDALLQRAQRDQILAFLVQGSQNIPENDAAGGRTIADLAGLVIERLAAAPEPLHRARVIGLLRADAPPEEIASALELAREQAPETGVQLHLAALGQLVNAGKGNKAFEIVALATEGRETVETELLSVWLGLAWQVGDAEAAERAIRVAVRSNAGKTLAESLERGFGVPFNQQSMAEVAYITGNIFAQRGAEGDDDRFYRLALEIDPRHPWANNNLAYRMTEDGEDLRRAEAMAVIAAEQLPEETAVLDTLGWARYRLGIITDTEVDGQRLEGALTLLRKAEAQADGADDPTIRLHLGDALWQAGEREQAVAEWERAASLARAVLVEQGGEPVGGTARNPVAAEAQRVLDESQARTRAHAAGEEPPVTPILATRPAAAPGAQNGALQ